MCFVRARRVSNVWAGSGGVAIGKLGLGTKTALVWGVVAGFPCSPDGVTDPEVLLENNSLSRDAEVCCC